MKSYNKGTIIGALVGGVFGVALAIGAVAFASTPRPTVAGSRCCSVARKGPDAILDPGPRPCGDYGAEASCSKRYCKTSSRERTAE